MQQMGPVISRHGLNLHGLRKIRTAHWNLTPPALYEEAVRRDEGVVGLGGVFIVETGQHTGRSVSDKFIVEEPDSKENIWWGKINRPIGENHFEALHEHILAHFEGKDAFVQDCIAGADPAYSLRVRVVTESAWHNLFAYNVFIQPAPEKLETFTPDFTVIQAPRCLADPAKHGTNSETFSLANFKRRLVLIGGTSYSGEIKKS